MSKSFEFYEFNLSLKQPVYVAGKPLHQRQIGILKISDENNVGFAEISPLPGLSIESFEENIESLKKHDFRSPSVAWGIVTATKMLTENLPSFKIKLNGLIQSSDYSECVEKALELNSLGYSHAKLKVGHRPVEESKQLIHEILNKTNLYLRLDANSLLSFEDAVRLASQLPLARIDYFEDPFQCHTENAFDQLESFYGVTGIQYAVDSHVPLKNNLMGLKNLVIKPTLMGHIPTFRNNILSSLFEGELGIYQAAAYVFKNNLLELTHGLDTLNFVENIFNFKKEGPVLHLPRTDEIKLQLETFLRHTHPTISGRIE